MQTKPITIIVAGAHPIYLEGLVAMIKRSHGFEIKGTASNGSQLIELYVSTQPDIILTDIRMPVTNGIQACIKIRKMNTEVGIILIAAETEEILQYQLLEAGANGCLLRNATLAQVLEAIHTVQAKQHTFPTETKDPLSSLKTYTTSNDAEIPLLTQREQSILIQLCNAKSTSEIAKQIGLSIRTIEQHKSSILKKLQVKNTIGLIVYALKHKLVDLGK